jgi:hypothetical protein
MKRRLFTLFSLLSLLLGIATVWWWTGSSGRIDQLSFEWRGSQSIRIWGSGGKILVTRTVFRTASPATASAGIGLGSGQIAWNSVAAVPASADPRLALSMFSRVTTTLPGSGGVESTFVLPAWLLALIFALLPTVWLARKLKGRKKAGASG